MTFVIVTGGIDLSVGSILGLMAILLGVFWKNVDCRCRLAMGLGLVVGTFAGFVNGIIITRFRVPPLIATLGTLALYRGLAEGICQARSVRGYPDWFFVLGQGQVPAYRRSSGLPRLVAIVAAVVLGCTTLAAPPMRSAPMRSRRGSPALGVDGTKICDLLGFGPRGGAGGGRSSSAGSPRRARTWAPASSSTRSLPSCSAAPRSSAGAAPSSAPCSGSS